MATPATAQKPATATPPAGFDVAKAKELSSKVNSNLVSAGASKYDRALLKQFQVAAGIAADGLYGGGARGALIFYGISNPPQPFFKPTATAPYPWTPTIAKSLGVVPAAKAAEPAASKPLASAPTKPAPVAASTPKASKPPAGFDLAKAKTLAPTVNTNLLTAGRDKYDRTLLKSFQTAAGIASDGLYGGGARGALIFYGISNPPQPFFKPTATTPYPWTAFIASSMQVTPPPATKTPTAPVIPITSAKPQTPVITVTGPRVVDAPQTRPDPLETHEQVEEYEPIPAPEAVAPGPVPIVVMPGADSDSDADAPKPAPESASGGGGSGVALLILGALAGGGWYYANKTKRRKQSTTYNY